MPATRVTTMTATAAAGLALALVAGMSPSTAKPLAGGTIHEEFSEVLRKFCDVRGLTVHRDVTVDGRFRIGSRGPDQLPYYRENVSTVLVDTNLATGRSVRTVERVLDKDHRVTDNGDGTSTILVLATGNSTTYDGSGKAIARNPGQVRFRILIDNGGTPQDPADDEFLEFLGLVKGSTGRSDDFCAAAVPALS